jgi:glycosyltransferase involved in cell wall biosynthesis
MTSINPRIKKIFLLLVSSGPGGAEKRFANLLKHLSENPDSEVYIDFYVNLSLAKQIPSFYQAAKNKNIRFVYFGFPLQIGKNSRFVFLSKRFDQVHLFFLLLFKRLFNSYDTAHFINLSALRYHFLVSTHKKIWSCFNSENPESELPTQSFELSRLYRELSHIDCLDENISNVIKSGIADYNINVTFSPCSFIDYHDANIQTKEMLLTFSGYFREYKGVLLLLEALKRCLETCTELKVQFLGQGDLEGTIRNELAFYLHSGRVEIGYAEHPMEKLKKSLIFVSLQQKENYPSQSLLEAMACGNAIIATNVGLTSLLVNENTGILIDYKVDQLSTAIEFLYHEKSLAIRLGENANSFVREKHTVEKFWSYLRAIYLT